MKLKDLWRKHRVLTVLLVGGLVWLGFFIYDPTGSDVNDLRWNETVTLQSGKEVHIRRHVHFREYSVWGLGGASSGPTDESYSIAMTDEPGFVLWKAPVQPMLLDRDPESGEWLVVAASYGESMWSANGAPCPPQWTFRLHGGAWYIQPIPVALLGRMPNVLMDLRVSDDADFSSVQFDREAAQRRKVQAPRGGGIPYGKEFVGDLTTYESLCKNISPPRFLDEFRTKKLTAISMEDFPRMPK